MAASAFVHIVTEADTAASLGSGDLPVLATPRLITWLEQATFTVGHTAVPPAHTTVGTLVRLEHLKPSPVGAEVTLTCSPPVTDGRRLIFHVQAHHADGAQIATGELHRWVVEPDRFLARLSASTDPASD